ncbi:MAG: methyltransferase domain-containing protein [Candidatus Omnitrophica bacterium]|nr:methyltransferase domain-containing protein [Candidatus Omnitrophota bacterium]
MSAPPEVRRETAVWHEAYQSDVLARRRRSSHARKLRRAGLLSMTRESRILDVCCGEGEMLEFLAREGYSSLVGLDLPAAPGKAEEAKGRRWHYASASATAFPFRAECFDCILCAHSLHHLGGLGNIEALLKEAYHSLKPGGRFIMIDHIDAPLVRLAFAVLFSPLAGLTQFTRMFRQQHLEEKDFLYDYLDHWPGLEALMRKSPFRNFKLEKKLFFFYWTGTK